MANEIPILLQWLAFMEWMLKHIAKFPRSHRYGLGLRMEQKLYEVLDLLIQAKYRKEKSVSLEEVGLCLEQMRLLVRLSRSLRIFPIKSHEFAAEQIEKAGQAAGAWRKHAEAKGG